MLKMEFLKPGIVGVQGSFLTRSPTFDFFLFLFGFRNVRTGLTQIESEFLGQAVNGANRVVEVGVDEGATSLRFCENTPKEAKVFLVDPYFKGRLLERLLGFSMAYFIARRILKNWKTKATFLRMPSLEAAKKFKEESIDFLFVDAVHTYEAVLQDFLTWGKKVKPGALIAFHDSQPCRARPDITMETGPVRLVLEIIQKKFFGWQFLESHDSLSLVRKE